MNYQWVLFDADNTLWDFEASEAQALEQCFLEFNIDYKSSFLKTYKRISKKVWKSFENGKIALDELRKIRFELFLNKIGIDKDPILFNQTYLSLLSLSDLMMPYAPRLLEDLHGKVKMALITNGFSEVQRPRIKATNIEKYFEAIIISDEIGVSKPRREYFEHTFEQIGNPDKKRVLVVGDNLNSDIRGGSSFGLDTCWYNPHNKYNNKKIKTTYEVNRLEGVYKILCG